MQMNPIWEQVLSENCVLSTSSAARTLLQLCDQAVPGRTYSQQFSQQLTAILTICWRQQPTEDSLQFLNLDSQVEAHWL